MINDLTEDLLKKESNVTMLTTKVRELKSEKLKKLKQLWYYKRKTVKACNGEDSESLRKELEQSYRILLDLEEKVKLLDNENCELEKTLALMEDPVVTSFKDGKFVNAVRETILNLLSLNVSQNRVNEVIRTVLKNLAHKEIDKLPSKGLRSRMMAEASFICNVQVAEAMKEGFDASSVIGNCLHEDQTSKHHTNYYNFQVTTKQGK